MVNSSVIGRSVGIGIGVVHRIEVVYSGVIDGVTFFHTLFRMIDDGRINSSVVLQQFMKFSNVEFKVCSPDHRLRR